MKLQKLTVKNFYDLGPFTVFAGPNKAGKSRLANAISFALCSRVVRQGTKKKDYGELVTEGTKAALIELQTDIVSVRRTLPDGQQTMLGDGAVYHKPFLAYCVDIHAFSAVPIAERRELLLDLTKTKESQGGVRNRMKKRGLDADKCDMVKPMLASGFEAAEDYAKEQARMEKANWRAITGKTWSPNNGETWDPAVPSVLPLKFDPADFEALKQKQSDKIDHLVAHEAGLRAKLTLLSNPYFDQDTIDSMRRELEERQRDVSDKKKSQADELGYLKERQKWLDILQKKLREGGAFASECPKCGALLETDHPGDVLFEVEGAMDKAELNERLEESKELEKEADRLLSNVKEWDRIILEDENKIVRLKEQLKRINDARQELLDGATDGEVTEEDVTNAEAEIYAAKQALAKLGTDYLDWKETEAARARAAENARKAAEHHTHVMQWLDIAEALSADGIQAEIVGQALEKVNGALAAYSKDSGLDSVLIDRDMVVRFGRRPYHLISESEQWRADLLLTMAIAQLSGIGFIVVDRLDILDLRSRQQVMNWLFGMSDIIQVIVFATLKSAVPAGEGITSHWLGGNDGK